MESWETLGLTIHAWPHSQVEAKGCRRTPICPATARYLPARPPELTCLLRGVGVDWKAARAYAVGQPPPKPGVAITHCYLRSPGCGLVLVEGCVGRSPPLESGHGFEVHDGSGRSACGAVEFGCVSCGAAEFERRELVDRRVHHPAGGRDPWHAGRGGGEGGRSGRGECSDPRGQCVRGRGHRGSQLGCANHVTRQGR
jgi:hypothetical protein